MTAKKHRPARAPADNPAGAIRRWTLIMLLAPAVIFIFYWFAGRTGGPGKIPQVPPPRHFYSAGTVVKAGNATLQAGPAGAGYLARTLYFGVNTVMAGPDELFAVVAVRATGAAVNQAGWRLIDGQGTVFRPLKAVDRNPLLEQPPAPVSGEKYLVFRVNAKTKYFYIQYTGPGGPVTWRTG
ncbi:hypothetical protein [Desulfotomaculum copahuensis]|uniref:DUF4352 domain-containing protein n=1 Tax=Desulfotomaculum copahuensis TaxID=1838280 RepID=A0A1B7LH06_9FIRM|nr:hypothetical protein [Desulfotomaculum copahuensis]OAT85480.1 hypothetical protein A6M21_06075 [Desulfotomaculum copahuensis]